MYAHIYRHTVSISTIRFAYNYNCIDYLTSTIFRSFNKYKFSHFLHTTRVPTESTIGCNAMMQSYQNTQQMFT